MRFQNIHAPCTGMVIQSSLFSKIRLSLTGPFWDFSLCSLIALLRLFRYAINRIFAFFEILCMCSIIDFGCHNISSDVRFLLLQLYDEFKGPFK